MRAEEAGVERLYRIRSLLGRSSWSADQLRDLVRDYAADALGCPDGVLVIDETGFLKKGHHADRTVAIKARHLRGEAGLVEKHQWIRVDPGLNALPGLTSFLDVQTILFCPRGRSFLKRMRFRRRKV